ncbi:PaaI family thioesterase [Enterovirga aerilata]|uniref:PaaI family thioesterase n=1 Tax=Enterovirga aerilata TaxID=2730920 RepID=A0A849I2J5_9HYPH|nr:PaaI family thioesterase [Enterovirga sp. DB1703]NNM73602.1 PaaI family thioesterase [Enterovirga sp. DB1703]
MTRAQPSRARRTPDDLRDEGWRTAEEDGFIGLVGPFWSKEEGDVRRFGFVAEPRHANLVGVVQGGMLMTFADRGLGILAWAAAGRPAVTTSFEMQFVGAGHIGSFIELEGEVVQRTKTMVFMRGLLRSGRRPVASCQGSWKILSERRA